MLLQQGKQVDMKIIYINDTLCLMQDKAKDLDEFDAWVLSGQLKTFDQKPYLVITDNEE